MGRLLGVDGETVWTESGLFIPQLNTYLKNLGGELSCFDWGLSRTIGGVLSSEGIDYNSFRMGNTENSVEEIEVVTPTGELMYCSRKKNEELFDLNLGGFGQFGVITKALLKITSVGKKHFSSESYDNKVMAVKDLLELAEIGLTDYMAMLDIGGKSAVLVAGFNSKDKKDYFDKDFKAQKRSVGAQKTGWSLFKFKSSKENPTLKMLRENMLSYLAQNSKMPVSKNLFFYGLYNTLGNTGFTRLCSAAVPQGKLFEMTSKIEGIAKKAFSDYYVFTLLAKSDGKSAYKGFMGVVNVFISEGTSPEKIMQAKKHVVAAAVKLGGRPFGDVPYARSFTSMDKDFCDAIKAKKNSTDPNLILNMHIDHTGHGHKKR